MRWLAVCLAVAALDALWARWTLAIAETHALAASAYAVALLLMGGWVTISYVKDKRLLWPAAVGAFVGTWLSVHYGG